MKKTMLSFILFTLLVISFSACQNPAGANGTSGRTVSGGGGGGAVGLYKCAVEFDIAPWACWDGADCRITATVSANGSNGVRIQSTPATKCDGTYFGVNLAAGGGSGATANIDGKGFKKIQFEIRGTIPANLLYFYAESSVGEIGSDYSLNNTQHYVGSDSYNADTWTKVTIPILGTDSMKAAFVCKAENGCTSSQYIDIRNIDWQNDAGESVLPVYK